jgi:hypothetical protein
MSRKLLARQANHALRTATQIKPVLKLNFIEGLQERDNGSVNRAATVNSAIDLSVASPLRVQHHVIGRRFIAKQFVPTFARINGNTARHDSATASLGNDARNAHQAK